MQPDNREDGHTANLERLLAKSPAALAGFAALRSALQSGTLSPRLRACLALVVSEANGCEYCLSRNVARARAAGLDDEAIADARQARSADAPLHAALSYAAGLVYAHGCVTGAETEQLRAAGFTDGDVVEIIAGVTLTLGENYFALAAGLETDGGERVCPLYDTADTARQRDPL
jgi:AhpD family alkylhydroperoxidase